MALSKKGKEFKLKTTQSKASKKLENHKKISFEFSDIKIATVSSRGVITEKKKGKCAIYIYAQNGVYKKITARVKN